jgi:uncharacterized membrane protein
MPAARGANPAVRHDAAVPPAVPSREDPAVTGASRLIGGPWGLHAIGPTSRWWTPLRIALGLTILVSLLGYLQKTPCISHGYVDDYQYTRVCYTDTYALYSVEGLNARTNAAGAVTGRISVPYRDHPVEYPPVLGGLMFVAAEITNAIHPNQPADGQDDRNTTFFEITALGLAACALLSTWTIAKLAGRRRVWDAVMVAASPVLLLHIVTNWDLAAVALTGLGLWAWSRGSPWSQAIAGVLLGLGIATKLYPVFVLLALVMLCLRAGFWRPAGRAIAGTVVGVVAGYLPAILVSRSFLFPSADCAAAHPLAGWRWFLSLSQTRGADWGSLWLVLQTIRGKPLDATGCGQAPALLNTLTALTVVLVVAGVAALVLLAPRRPRVGQVAFLLVAGFVLLNKVDSPQYALWLVPLAVLARPRWASLLVWQVTEVLLGVANLYTLIAEDHSDQGLPIDTYLIVLVVRDLVLLWLLAMVVREVLHPELDVVRRDGVDDPAGGVLDGASDRYVGSRSATTAPV